MTSSHAPVMWWISSARVSTLASDFSHAAKPSHVAQPSAPVVQIAFLSHAVEANAPYLYVQTWGCPVASRVHCNCVVQSFCLHESFQTEDAVLRWRLLCRLAMAAVNRVGGLAAGIANAIFVKFYQYVVDPAEADTWPFRLFAFLAKGVLR